MVATGIRCRAAIGLLVAALAGTGLGAAPVAAAAPPRVVSLSFDDERVSQAVVGGLLSSRRLHGTFFVISRAVDTGNDPESLTWAQLSRLAHAGNEIAGHTRTHPHLPTLSRPKQVDEICGSRRDLVAAGFRPVSFAYPYGEYDATTEQVVRQCGYASGRAAWGGTETIPPADRYAVRTPQNVTDSDTVAGLEAETTTAKPGEWLNYVFHDIGDPYPDGDQYRIQTKDFTAFLDWLAHERDAGAVVVRTIGAVLH
ncbi:MAG TPA: polysaccharide deacetylase family protein [Acidimicrobiia bacterium]|nr:polysaccharide deacetylase family protein [Acidimicrobiia bacterium]